LENLKYNIPHDVNFDYDRYYLNNLSVKKRLREQISINLKENYDKLEEVGNTNNINNMDYIFDYKQYKKNNLYNILKQSNENEFNYQLSQHHSRLKK
jgi:hypothetical protein